MKYKLTDNTMVYNNVLLHQIQAIVDIGDDVKAGDLGGWVDVNEFVNNLNQYNNCWVYPSGKLIKSNIFYNVKVFGTVIRSILTEDVYIGENTKWVLFDLTTKKINSKDRVELLFHENFINNIIV